MFLGVQAGPGRYGWPISEWINPFMSLMNFLCIWNITCLECIYYIINIKCHLIFVYVYLAHTRFTYVIYAYSVIEFTDLLINS